MTKRKREKPKQCDRRWKFCERCQQHIDTTIDHEVECPWSAAAFGGE